MIHFTRKWKYHKQVLKNRIGIFVTLSHTP